MAQAQKSVGIGSIERFVGFIGNMAAAGFQQAADKLDVDQAIDEYGDMLGVPTTITKSDEQVQAEREQRAAATGSAEPADGRWCRRYREDSQPIRNR